MLRCITLATTLAAFLLFTGFAAAAEPGSVASWTAALHGPYPSGNAVGQPDLRFAFPEPSANDQTFRLIIRPDLLARRVRLRFSNVFGAQAASFDNVFVGLQESGPSIVRSTNRRVTFAGGYVLNIPMRLTSTFWRTSRPGRPWGVNWLSVFTW